MDNFRELVYPLGFLSALIFGARVLFQWIHSEAKGKSTVTPLFWQLSLTGNLLLFVHSFIQVQFHVCFFQVCNAVISWRNLNLMQPKARQVSTSKTVCILLGTMGSAALAFVIQGYLFQDHLKWFGIPDTPWAMHSEKQVAFTWHVIGFFGLALFNSRFWVQWWYIEKYKVSHLGSSFWLFSIFGETLCLAYFLRIDDPVNFIGPAFGLIAYLRNLMLIFKGKKQSFPSEG